MFKKTVKPIDDTRKFAIEESQKLEEKIASSEDKIHSNAQLTGDAQNDLKEQEAQRHGHIDTKVELHKKMDEFKSNILLSYHNL